MRLDLYLKRQTQYTKFNITTDIRSKRQILYGIGEIKMINLAWICVIVLWLMMIYLLVKTTKETFITTKNYFLRKSR